MKRLTDKQKETLMVSGLLVLLLGGILFNFIMVLIGLIKVLFFETGSRLLTTYFFINQLCWVYACSITLATLNN